MRSGRVHKHVSKSMRAQHYNLRLLQESRTSFSSRWIYRIMKWGDLWVVRCFLDTSIHLLTASSWITWLYLCAAALNKTTTLSEYSTTQNNATTQSCNSFPFFCLNTRFPRFGVKHCELRQFWHKKSQRHVYVSCGSTVFHTWPVNRRTAPRGHA